MLTIEEALVANTTLEHQDFVDYALVVDDVFMREAWPSGHGDAPTDEQIEVWRNA